MRNLRKVMACVLALVMCLSLLPGTANAVKEFDQTTGAYSMDVGDDTLIIGITPQLTVTMSCHPAYGKTYPMLEYGEIYSSYDKTVLAFNEEKTDYYNDTTIGLAVDALKGGTTTLHSSIDVLYWNERTITVWRDWYWDYNGKYPCTGTIQCPKCGTVEQFYWDSTWVIDIPITVYDTFTINYDANGGTVSKTSDSVREAVSEYDFTNRAPTPTKDGYKFLGWAASANATQAEADALIVTSPTNGVKTVYAVWEEDDPATYTVTYTDGVEGEIVFADEGFEDLKEGDTTPACTRSTDRDGYTFMGWAPTVNPVVSGDDATDGEIVYTATWKADTTYTVTYVDGAGKRVFGDESHGGLKAGEPTPAFANGTTPTRNDGYTFDGWDPEVSSTVTGDATYTAKWACAHTKDANGNCTVPNCDHGDCCTKPPVHTHDYTWQDNGDGTHTGTCNGTGTCDAPTVTNEAHTDDGTGHCSKCGACLHTKDSDGNCTVPNCDHGDCCPKDEGEDPVIPETTYTVTFCANGGTFAGSGEHVVYSSLKAGETVNVPANPTRDGYTFNGWAPAVQQGFVTVTGNETYYAQWTEETEPAPVPNPSAQAKIYSMNENTQKVGGTFVFEGVVWNDGNCDIENANFKVVVPKEVKLEDANSVHLMYAGSEEPEVNVSNYSETEGTTITWTLNKFEVGRSLVLSLSAKAVATGNFDVLLGFSSDNFNKFAFDEDTVSTRARMASAGTTFAPVSASGTVTCPHEHTEGIVTKQPTCTEAGEKATKCLDCGEVFNRETVPGGHGANKTIPGTAPTCTTPGTTDSIVCEVCGAVRTPATEIPATGHSMVETSRVASTCTAAGSVTSTCSKCSHTETNSLPLAAHTPGAWVTVREPAVGVEGLEEQHCTVCDALLDSRAIPALDEEETPCAHEHTTTAVTKAASCEAAGEQTVTCDDCGALVATNPIPATGHSWDAGTVTTAATATTDGVRTYVCRNDPSHTRTETIPATGVITTPTPVDPTPADPTPAAPAPADPTPAAPAETDVPDAETPLDAGTDIQDGETPLAGAFGLDNANHFAYMLGYGDGTIRPEANITRAEVATIFFRLMTDEFRSANWATENDFSDVSLGQWFNNAISTSANAGKLGGYGDGSFRPNNNITRAEFAAIAVRFLSDEVQGVSGGSFKDTEGHWAAVEIGRAAAAGWITGYGDGTFRPDEYITRAEAAAIINRMLGRVPDAEHLLDEMTVWSDNPATQWYYADIQEATNSHAYDRDELGVTEMWTALQETRDWQALESQWAAQAE